MEAKLNYVVLRQVLGLLLIHHSRHALQLLQFGTIGNKTLQIIEVMLATNASYKKFIDLDYVNLFSYVQ